MSHDATMRRMYDLISAGDIDGLIDLLADDFVDHEQMPPGIAKDKSGVAAFFTRQLEAMPDMRMDVQDVIAQDDKVVARVAFTGTHTGDILGVPATGRRVEVGVIDIMAFGDDGLVPEHWGVMDMMEMMQQLGAVPAGPQT